MAQSKAIKKGRVSSFFTGSADIAAPRLAMVLAVFFLSIIGLIMVYSASSIEAINEGASPTAYVTRHALHMAIGIVVCALLALRFPYNIWQGKFLSLFWIGTLVLLGLTAAIGTVGLGAQRWLTIAGFSGQPSELAKPAFVLMAARIMFDLRTKETNINSFYMQVLLLIVLPLAFLYVTQSDLGTTLICLVGIMTVVFLSGARASTMLALVAGLFCFGLLAVLRASYRSDRLSFLNPEADYYGAGYQLVRSLYAFGEGGLFGVGLGNSTEKYLYLPEAETDFIFAIVGEELGLVGAVLVIVAFLVILWAGLRIAKGAPDLFGSLIAGGCTVMLVFQAFLNIGCVTGMLPTTGKPLPFISSGGSAVISAFFLVGLILSVSFAQDGTSPFYDRRRNELKVVRAGGKSTRKGR